MSNRFKAVFLRAASLFAIVTLLSGVTASAAHAGAPAELNSAPSSSLSGMQPGGYVLSPVFGDPFNLAEQSGQPVSSATSTTTRGPAEKSGTVPTIASYGKAFVPDLANGTKRIFSADIAPIALIGAGLTGVAFLLDQTVEDYFQDHQPIGHVSHYGDSWGQGAVPFALGAALFATGEIISDKQLADTGVVSIEALVVTGLTTEALKYITHRQRPNGKDDMSFPSGHASMTAALAASVSEMYDWNIYIAVPLFTASAFVGASRIQDDMHHLSDVVAGMTLGTVVGISFARSHKEKDDAGSSRLSVAPYIDGSYKGVVFNWRF